MTMNARRPWALMPTMQDQPETPTPQPTRKASRFVWPLLIFFIALALRGIYVHQFRACPFYGHEQVDAEFNRQWGEAVAAGRTFMPGPYFRGPLYPWMLGGIYRLAGRSDLAPRLVQVVLGSLSCVLVYLIGTRTFSFGVGIVAGLAAAGYWIFLYFDAELLDATLSMFLVLLMLWFMVIGGDRRKIGWWGLSGLTFGLAAIARPNVLIFAPVALFWIILLERARPARALAGLAAFVIATAAVIAPVTIRNAVVGQDRVLIASTAGVNLYIGNNPHSDGMSAIVPGTPAEFWPGYRAQVRRAEQAAGRKLKPSEVSAYYAGEALKFIREHPRAAARLLARKVAIFWSGWEVSNNQDIRFITGTYTPVVRYLPLTFTVVAPLGLLGLLVAMRRQAGRHLPLWGFVLSYMVGVVIFFVNARYRLPVVPVLMIFAAYALFWLAETIRQRRWLVGAASVAVLALGGMVAVRTPYGVEIGAALSRTAAGIVLLEQGKAAEGEALLQAAVDEYANQPKAWFNLGLSRMQQGDYHHAESHLRKVVELSPNFADAYKHLGFVLVQLDRHDEAIAALERAAELTPGDAKLHSNLGGALVQSGRMDEGIASLRRASQLDPQTLDHLAGVGMALARAQRCADSRRVLESGLEDFPDNVKLLTILAKLLATCPDPAQQDAAGAVRVAQRACDLSQSADPDALDALAAAHNAAGDHALAVATARHAQALAKQQGKSQLAAGIQLRIQFYEARQRSAETPPPPEP